MKLPTPLLFLMIPTDPDIDVADELVIPVARDAKGTSEKCCTEAHLVLCQEVDINRKLLFRKRDIKILGSTYTYSNPIDPHGLVYKTEAGDEAVITFRGNNGNMFGSIKTSEGRSFAIEKCVGGHVIKEYDMKSFAEDQGILSPENAPTLIPPMARDSKDTSAVVNYSVMLYYTQEVEDNVADLDGFFDQMLAETNQGYIQSDVPVRLTKFCIEKATIEEMPFAPDSASVLHAFRKMKGSDAALRNTADAAALIVMNLPSCGAAYLYAYDNGLTFSVTKKSCATGYYSFGHEIAHNFGCGHNREVATNNVIPHGHAYLIEGGNNKFGVRTILSYKLEGHSQRVNYYSNPKIIYPPTGTPTGTAESDNAAVFVRNRWSFASIGNESASCFNPNSETTDTDSSSTTATLIPECIEGGKHFFGAFKAFTSVSLDECREACNEHPKCQYWRWKRGSEDNDIDWTDIGENSKCWLIRITTKQIEAFEAYSSGQKHCTFNEEIEL